MSAATKSTWACFDLNGKPAINQSDGYHTVRKSYDERGNCIALEYYGVDGQRCLTKGGYAKSTAKYDERGNGIEDGLFRLRRQIGTKTEGYARITGATMSAATGSKWPISTRRGKAVHYYGGLCEHYRDYDERGNRSQVGLLWLGDEPAIDQSDGYSQGKESYDEHGNCIAWEYYGADGRRCLTKDGYAKVTAEYDERGSQLKWACFDLNGKPAIDQSDGVSHGQEVLRRTRQLYRLGILRRGRPALLN